MITKARQNLESTPKVWLITGVAGFIGSNLLEFLLDMGQKVIGLDNFSTGSKKNLDEALRIVSEPKRKNFIFIEGDIRDLGTCNSACSGVDYVLHQAALGSVPRSISDPIKTHQTNVDGFLNILVAARDARVNRLVYASSSSVYGDHPDLPKVEDKIGHQLSPYAVSKYSNELYASVFASNYNLQCIGLRYFNVFGRRQDPTGAYAAVIPRWFYGMMQNKTIEIFGDGETSRDFCYIANVIQANILAACSENPAAVNNIYNIAFGQKTSLNELFSYIRRRVAEYRPEIARIEPNYSEFRAGDVRHSLADISKAINLLGYCPTHSVEEGLNEATSWYLGRHWD